MESTVRAISPIVTVSCLLAIASSKSSAAPAPAAMLCPGSPEAPPAEVKAEFRPCPDGMLTVSSFCVDRFEAPNAAGRNPTVMASALDADRLCREVGKRLCTEAEWERACSGPSRLRYPYGQVHEPGRCNDGKRWMRVDEAALASWPSDRSKREADRLWQGEPSGFRPGCSSEEGVQDMVGNVEEWVRRGSGYALKGCYWASCFGGSSPTCTWTNAVHGPTFQFYETGFRCCADKAAP